MTLLRASPAVMLVCPPQVSIIYMASLYLALPSEFDTFVTRCQIYVKVIRWWRRIKPAVILRRTLQRARIAVWTQRCFKKWRYDSERVRLMGIREEWAAQKNEIALLRSQLEKMKEMYAEVGKKAGALPEVMGKFSELQAYAKSIKVSVMVSVVHRSSIVAKKNINAIFWDGAGLYFSATPFNRRCTGRIRAAHRRS